MTCYQARAGQVFTQAIGVQRLRDYSLAQQQRLVSLLAERGVARDGWQSGLWRIHRRRTAVVTARPRARAAPSTHWPPGASFADSRAHRIRLCPDVLTTTDELDLAARAVAEAIPP